MPNATKGPRVPTKNVETTTQRGFVPEGEQACEEEGQAYIPALVRISLGKVFALVSVFFLNVTLRRRATTHVVGPLASMACFC